MKLSDFNKAVKAEIQETDALIAETDKALAKIPNAVKIESSDDDRLSGNAKLDRLIDDDFPFDESQLVAVNGLVQQQYGCMIGAAGVGKTTVTKKLVDLLHQGVGEVEMSGYWTRGDSAADPDDEYEIPDHKIPSIIMVSFTGRATQQIKKNFPRDWHGNIMTIHRMLGFYPEFYEGEDDEGNIVNKRRFIPTYNEDQQLPWDIIIIDEAGMLGLELWHQLWAATPSTTRIYMIGDINQLPPTHGKPILGFALASWPTWELTHVHRQQGANNSIVDNAHHILNGRKPVCDSGKTMSIVPLSKAAEPDAKLRMKPMLDSLQMLANDDSWKFLIIEIDGEHRVASTRIRQLLKLLHGKLYEPNRDVVITPINGTEQTQPGYSLGQIPMNQELVTQLNQDSVRYLIDGGREKRNFAIGDKVMATINDYTAGITNGMTGIVTGISPNGAFAGDYNRWGPIEDVNNYFAGLHDESMEEEIEFDMEAMVADAEIGMEEFKRKEKRDSGPASHIVTVKFGEGEHAFEIDFASKSQVASLMLAYVVTCHKMQGGEAPLVFTIAHQQNKRPLCREWLYTAVTRASERHVLLTTRQGLAIALGKQTIKGKTLPEKVKNFQELTKTGPLGALVNVRLPKARSLVESHELILPSNSFQGALEKVNSLERLKQKPKPETVKPEVRDRIIRETIYQTIFVEREVDSVPETVDGGDLRGVRVAGDESRAVDSNPDSNLLQAPSLALPAPPKFVSTWGAIQTKMALEDAQAIKLLTHEKPKPVNRLSMLLKAQRNPK